MKIQKILKAGQPGTKKLAKQYGENLICVRYRCDPAQKRKLKTIELVIDSQPWQPSSDFIPMNKLMNLRIAIEETALRNRVKAAGGTWLRRKQVWQLPYREVVELGLTKRIVE